MGGGIKKITLMTDWQTVLTQKAVKNDNRHLDSLLLSGRSYFIYVVKQTMTIALLQTCRLSNPKICFKMSKMGTCHGVDFLCLTNTDETP